MPLSTRASIAKDPRKGAISAVGLTALSFLMIAALAPLSNALAAEAPPAGTDTSTDETATAPAPPASGSERRRAGDKGGVFRPSEDISEDVAITFPVDI